MKTFNLYLSIGIVLLLASCGEPPSSGYPQPQQIGDPVVTLLPPAYEYQTERINNCDGASPNYLVSYKTVESQNATFQVVVEAGGLITGTPIPAALEVQLEAKINAALSKQYGITIERDHQLPLEIPNGKKVEHVITWKVTRIEGLIDVYYQNETAQVAFNRIASVELYDRTSTDLSCDTNVIDLTPPADATLDIASTTPEEISTTPPPTKIQNTESISINGTLYLLPNASVSPFCIAQEIHTQGENKINYDINVPKGWVMAWSSYKAYWPGNQYLDSGLLVIIGPWQGEITIDTGGSCSGPIEWIDWIIENRMNDYPVPSRPIYYLGKRP